ncbi:hypothetical protein BSNK01_03540 [Bacillaceae bacterium]
MKSNLSTQTSAGNGISPVIIGLSVVLFLVLLGSLLVALFLNFTEMKEKNMTFLTYLVNGISLLVGGFFTGKKCRNKGWYYGGLTGIAYFFVIAAVGFLAFDISLNLSSFTYLLYAFLISAVGGMIGVNWSHK